MGIVVGFSILSIMMIVHELGHFLTGLRLGFKIEEFSLFMGPVLFSRTRRGIKYSIKLFPIGASVRFAENIPMTWCREMTIRDTFLIGRNGPVPLSSEPGRPLIFVRNPGLFYYVYLFRLYRTCDCPGQQQYSGLRGRFAGRGSDHRRGGRVHSNHP